MTEIGRTRTGDVVHYYPADDNRSMTGRRQRTQASADVVTACGHRFPLRYAGDAERWLAENIDGPSKEFRVTFGQMYRTLPHAKFPPAHPDGWLTIVAYTESHARAIAFLELGRIVPAIVEPELEPEP